MNWKSYYQFLKRDLSFINDEGEADAIAKRIIEHFNDKAFLEVFISNSKVEENSIKNIKKVINQLRKNKPIQYIFGYNYFDNLKIKVNKHTLIPRPETEEMVLNASKSIQSPEKIIDFCTGSGCIAIALAKRFPSSQIIATDISEKALKIAKENAKIHNVNKQISFIKHDILTHNFDFIFQADLIISNPPYISNSERHTMSKQVLEFEPSEALFVQSTDTLIFYKQIINNIHRLIKMDGLAWFEISYLRTKELETYLKNIQFIKYNFHKDMFGKSRFLEIKRLECC